MRLVVDELVAAYGDLAAVVRPAVIGPTVIDDPDDDQVLACAVAARADSIVSGDRHLLSLRRFGGIDIMTVAAAVARTSASNAGRPMA